MESEVGSRENPGYVVVHDGRARLTRPEFVVGEGEGEGEGEGKTIVMLDAQHEYVLDAI